MGRRMRRGLNRSYNKTLKGNNIYVCNLSASQAFELFDSADTELAKPIFESFIITFIGVFMIAQINVSSRPQNSEWVDSLKSVKDIKQRIINGSPGMIVSACYGMSIAYPYAMEDLESEGATQYNILITIVDEMINSHSTNIKRLRPSKQDWLPFARGEMGAVKGQLLSCPSTNLAIMNIEGSDVIGYTISDAMGKIGFERSLFNKYDIDVEYIREKLRRIFLTDKGGIPIENLVYEEPNYVNSRIQNEILGDCIIRNETIKSKLEKGVEPVTAINKTALVKFLTKNELFAYNIAIRTGDAQMARKLTNIAIVRSKDPI